MIPGGCHAKVAAPDLISSLRTIFPMIDEKDFQDCHSISVPGVGLDIESSVDLIYDMNLGLYVLGYVAVVHSLSDVFAALADPFSVLWVAGFPSREPLSALTELVTGAVDAMNDHRLQFGGGHSVASETAFLSVTSLGTRQGRAALEREVEYALIVTKKLGSGLGIAGAREGLLTDVEAGQLVASMKTSNALASREASRLAQRGDVGFATDITGFGLLYGLKTQLDSGWRAVVSVADVPVWDFARRLLEEEALCTVLGERNWFEMREASSGPSGVSWEDGLLLSDPQTSGGLLVAVKASAVHEFTDQVDSYVIGTIDYCPENAGLLLSVNKERYESQET